MRTRTINSILKKLQKGLSLRQIGESVGVSNQTIWRIGDRHGVYSNRSKRTTKTA
jgi:hypothetical protein